MSTVGPSQRVRRAQTNRNRKNRLCDGKYLIVMYVFMWCMFNPCLYVLYGNSVGKRSRTVGGKMVSVLLSKGEKNRYEEQGNNVFTTEHTLCKSYLCLCLYDGKYVGWTIQGFCVNTATYRGTQSLFPSTRNAVRKEGKEVVRARESKRGREGVVIETERKREKKGGENHKNEGKKLVWSIFVTRRGRGERERESKGEGEREREKRESMKRSDGNGKEKPKLIGSKWS